MNKHILTFSQIINESIGVGSVLLIKGKQSSDGRYLYATTIKGSVEIKPGIKMVFIGDEIYRVINKEGRFFGRKISYGSEEGLKGIFNMKNPGRPSIVLNHNKTPFHWITLKFTDIGSALREIGPRLFSHELILESDIDADGIEDSQDDEISVPIDDMDQRIKSEENYNSEERQKELHDIVCIEVFKAISGKESKLNPKIVGSDDDGWEDSLSEIEDNYETFDWQINMEVYLDPNNFREYERELADLEIGGDFMDMLDVQSSIQVSLHFTSDVSVKHIHERGDYYEPDYYETEIDSIDTSIEGIVIDDIYGNGDIASGLPQTVEITSDSAGRYTREDMTPSEIISDIEHCIIKSNGSYNGLSDEQKFRFNKREASIKRSKVYSDSVKALSSFSKESKNPNMIKLAKEISEYWKKETGLDKISNRDLLRLQRYKSRLDYSVEVEKLKGRTSAENIPIKSQLTSLKKEIDRISKLN